MVDGSSVVITYLASQIPISEMVQYSNFPITHPYIYITISFRNIGVLSDSIHSPLGLLNAFLVAAVSAFYRQLFQIDITVDWRYDLYKRSF